MHMKCLYWGIYFVLMQILEMAVWLLPFIFLSIVLVINTCFSLTWPFSGISSVARCFIVGSLTKV
jgi:hypothetical protein